MNCKEQTDPSHQPFECLQHPKQGYTQFRIPQLWDILLLSMMLLLLVMIDDTYYYL